MHIRHNAFSREAHRKSTVLPCNQTIPSSELGNSCTGTKLDFLHINLLYCKGMGVKNPFTVVPENLSLCLSNSNKYISANNFMLLAPNRH